MLSHALSVRVVVFAVKRLQLELTHLVQVPIVERHMWKVYLLSSTNERMLQRLQRCQPISRVNLENLLYKVIKLDDLSAFVESILDFLTFFGSIFEFDVMPLFKKLLQVVLKVVVCRDFNRVMVFHWHACHKEVWKRFEYVSLLLRVPHEQSVPIDRVVNHVIWR